MMDGTAGKHEPGLEPDGEAPLPAVSILAILPYIMLPMALAVADQTMVSTALADIAGALGGVAHISWIIVGNLVAATIAAPVYGQLRDTLGSRRMMLIALAIYIAASVFCAAAVSLGMLVLGRILQGLGGGGLMTLAQAMIGEAIPPRERAKYQGYLATVMVTATTVGPVLGGYLTTHFGWRSVFLFNVPLGLLAMLMTLRIPKRAGSGGSWTFDYRGLALFIAFIAPLLLALDAARHLTVQIIPQVLALLAFAVASLFALLRQERRALHPLLPLTLLSQRTIWMSDILAACHGAVLVSLVTLLPLYLHVMKGATPSETGMLLIPMMFGIGFGAFLTGRLVSRTGRTAIFPSVGLIVATVLMLIQALGIDHFTRTQLALNLLAGGLAMGTVMSVVQVAVQSVAGRAALGSAAASIQISRSVGAAIGTALTGAVLFASLQLGHADAAGAFEALFQGTGGGGTAALAPEVAASIAQAFRAAFLTLAAFTALGAIAAWSIPQRRL